MPSHSATYSAHLFRQVSRHRMHEIANWLHSSVWPILLLIGMALGLLWAFHQVTRGIVRQSEVRTQITNEYNKATWRCNSMSGRLARKNCLLQRPVMASTTPAQKP